MRTWLYCCTLKVRKWAHLSQSVPCVYYRTYFSSIVISKYLWESSLLYLMFFLDYDICMSNKAITFSKSLSSCLVTMIFCQKISRTKRLNKCPLHLPGHSLKSMSLSLMVILHQGIFLKNLSVNSILYTVSALSEYHLWVDWDIGLSYYAELHWTVVYWEASFPVPFYCI